MSRFCTLCGGAGEPADRFCGLCGAPLESHGLTGAPSAASGQAQPQSSSSGRSGCGCGCGTVGCLGILLLLGVTGPAGYVLLQKDRQARVASAIDSIKGLVDEVVESNSVVDAEPEAAEAEEPRGRDLTTEEREALAAVAGGAGPAAERLAASAALQQAGASAQEIAEIEAQQQRAMAELDAAIARERDRREQFAKEAATGGWLRQADAVAGEVWRAAGGR
jgi:hypothetical protein